MTATVSNNGTLVGSAADKEFLDNKVTIKNPHAAVIVWNYEDRIGSEDTKKDPNDTNEVIISTVSCVSISTQKSKMSPTGKFTLVLAPTKNWVSVLTSGSWCALLMSQDPILPEDIPSSGYRSTAKANKKHVKMLGRITSVRVNVDVDQTTGARKTLYTVEGVDWSNIFDNHIYIDPYISKDNNIIGNATSLALFKQMEEAYKNKNIFSVLDNVQTLISIMGKPLTDGMNKYAQEVNRVAKGDYDFRLPKAVAQYFDFVDDDGVSLSGKRKMTEVMRVIYGVLTSYDKYEDKGNLAGFVNPATMIGTNTMWQILMDNCCSVINELVPEMRWENKDDGRPTLALYCRVKPFVHQKKNQVMKDIQNILRRENKGVSVDVGNIEGADKPSTGKITAEIENLMSQYKNVRYAKIPLHDVIGIDAGTNWRDKYNFAEIKFNSQLFHQFGPIVKAYAQTADENAFQREGFRPLILASKQFPKKDSDNLSVDVNLFAAWKHLLREWYFETHRMLNGRITFVGQSDYIQVGQNIMVDLRVLGPTTNIIADAVNMSKELFLLLHVESVSHNFRVNPDTGARSFATTITFTRGIVVDKKRDYVGKGMLDDKASDISTKEDKNVVTVFGTSERDDPDPQKLKGT